MAFTVPLATLNALFCGMEIGKIANSEFSA